MARLDNLTYGRDIKMFILFSCFLVGVSLVGTPGEKFFHPNFCLVKKLIGIPCPACGITRSVYEVLALHIGKAVKYNSAGLLVAILLVANWFYYLLAVATDRFQFSLNQEKQLLYVENWVLALSLMGAWILKLFKV